MSSAPMTMKKRIITIIMGVGFLGFMGTQIQGMISEGRQASRQQEQQANQVRQQQLEELQAREKGYEKVLEREPNHQNALEGVVQTRIDMKEYEEAIPPLEKLVELKPEREDYQEVLAQLKQATSPSQDKGNTSAEEK